MANKRPRISKKDYRIKRNKRLENYFLKYIEPQNFKVINNLDNPAVIYKDKLLLSCYVHNFYLHFIDEPHGGKIMHTIKLTHIIDDDEEAFHHWFNNAEHKECFYVQVKGTDLRLSGYNFRDKSDKENPKDMYPVFSQYGFKNYFQRETAQEKIDQFQTEKLQLEII